MKKTMMMKKMYRLTIKTKYNTIVLDTEDYNSPEIQEILEQPYVVEIRIDKIDKSKTLKRCKK